MKDKHDNVTYDIFQQDTLSWLENNVETIAKQVDGSYRVSYLKGNYFNFVEAKTIEECVKLARG